MSNDFSEFTYLECYPPDGKYLCRLDEDEDPSEIMEIEVVDGKAYKNGRQQFIYGFEWKAV